MSNNKAHSFVGRVAAITLSIFIALIILLSALSDILVDNNPDLALVFNPLNASARINLLVRDVEEEIDPAKLPRLEKIARAGIRAEPFDARFYSYLGVIVENGDKPEIARTLYRHSLSLLSTEIQALSRLFSYNARTGNFQRAIEIADIIIRRWIDYRYLVTPYLAALMSEKKAYAEALDRFPQQIDGTKTLIDALLVDPSSYDLAYRVVLDWSARGIPELQQTRNQVINRIFSNGQYRKAYRLFLRTLDEKEKSVSGYIFNSSFLLPASGSVFDWDLRRQAGLNMQIVDVPANQAFTSSKPTRALEINFQDSPVKLLPVGQFLNLPPATFNLKVTYSTRDYKAPNPVNVSVMCRTGKVLTRLLLVADKPGITELTGSFMVPQQDCSVQAIRFSNGDFIESWKNKSSGSVFIYQALILLGGG